MMPVMMSEIEAGTLRLVCSPLAPLSNTARSSEIAIIAKGLNCASQHTTIAVNPTPSATSEYRVMFAPEHTMNPTSPQIAPEMHAVLSVTLVTFIPA